MIRVDIVYDECLNIFMFVKKLYGLSLSSETINYYVCLSVCLVYGSFTRKAYYMEDVGKLKVI